MTQKQFDRHRLYVRTPDKIRQWGEDYAQVYYTGSKIFRYTQIPWNLYIELMKSHPTEYLEHIAILDKLEKQYKMEQKLKRLSEDFE